MVNGEIKPIPYAEGAGELAFTSRRRHVLHVDIHKLKSANTDGVLSSERAITKENIRNRRV